MRTLANLAALTFTLGLGACLFAEPAPTTGGFVVPSGAVPVGVEGVYLASGSEDSGPLPPPTNGATAPVIVGVDAKNTGDHSFSLVVEVESPIGVDRMHLDINGRHFVVPLSGESVALDACAILQEQQGYGCTKACVDACSCVSCESAEMERNMEGACATTCTANWHSGALDDPPYDGSEVRLADAVYNGYDAVPGTISSVPSCSGSVCASAAAAAKRTAQIAFFVQDWSFLADIGVNTLVAETQPADAPVETSQPFAAGKVSQSACPGIANCDGAKPK